MPKTKRAGLIRLIYALKEGEIEQFQRFVLFRLGDIASVSLLEEFTRLRKLKNGEKVSGAGNYHMHSRLRKVIYEYLAWVALEKKSMSQYPLLIKELNYRDLNQEASRALKRYEKEIEKMTGRSVGYFLHKSNHAYQSLIHSNGNFTHKKPSQIEEVRIAKEQQHLLECLRLLCLESSLALLYGEELDTEKIAWYSSELEQKPENLAIDSIFIYYVQLQILLRPYEQIPEANLALEKFLSIFKEYESEEYYEVYGMFLNYFTRLWMAGIAKEDYFHFYWMGLQKGLILAKEKGELPFSSGLNLFYAMIFVKGVDFTRDNLKEITTRLNPLLKDSGRPFFEAGLAFYEGKFAQAKTILPTHAPETGMELHRRLLALQIDHSQEEDINWLLALAHRDRMWVTRSKALANGTRKYYGKLLGVYHSFLKRNTAPVEKFKTALKGMPFTPFKHWLENLLD